MESASHHIEEHDKDNDKLHCGAKALSSIVPHRDGVWVHLEDLGPTETEDEKGEARGNRVHRQAEDSSVDCEGGRSSNDPRANGPSKEGPGDAPEALRPPRSEEFFSIHITIVLPCPDVEPDDKEFDDVGDARCD